MSLQRACVPQQKFLNDCDIVGSAVKTRIHETEGINISPEAHLQVHPSVSPVAEPFAAAREPPGPGCLVELLPIQSFEFACRPGNGDVMHIGLFQCRRVVCAIHIGLLHRVVPGSIQHCNDIELQPF